MSDSTLSLFAEAVSVSFGRRTALADVNFDWTGGVLGIAGANGSGKSTLLRVLAGMQRASAGEIVLLRDDAPASLRTLRIGYVPQAFTFPPSLRIEDFVGYSAWLQGVADARRVARDALARVGLGSEARTRIGAASGGMVRRAGLASALVGEPELLVLDEPTTGVDVEQRKAMRSIIVREAQERSIAISSHIAEDLERVASMLVVLDAGRAVFTGPVSEALATAGVGTLEEAIVALPHTALAR